MCRPFAGPLQRTLLCTQEEKLTAVEDSNLQPFEPKADTLPLRHRNPLTLNKEISKIISYNTRQFQNLQNRINIDYDTAILPVSITAFTKSFPKRPMM